jgi:aqualysin 1
MRRITMRPPIIASVLLLALAAASAQTRSDAPSHRYGSSRAIPDQYIVVFKREAAEPAQLAAQLASQHGGQLLRTYGHAIKGFTVRLPARAIAALRQHPLVDWVEQDATLSLSEAQIAPPMQQANATWGLDRVDQAGSGLDGRYLYQYTGAGVYAFVVDTGILAEHQDFGGRVSGGYSAIADGRGTSDCNGHGTHVAGTLGGSQWGVAKGVALVPVRVLDCSGSGSNSGVIAGIDWLAGQSAQRPAVANMSLGGGFSSALNSAVAGAVSKGVTMVVAAGNSSADACNYSPASEPSAITVGATTSSDARASYSNYGQCLDLFAPGSSITSSWYTATNASATLSGTSMASPHVAGIAALALAANGAASPSSVTSFLLGNANSGVVGTAGAGSPNRLAYSMAAGAPGASTPSTFAVSALSGKGVKAGRDWAATATVTVKLHDGSRFTTAVSGATVNGSFSPGGSGSCITGSTGSCTLRSSVIPRSSSSSSFAVGNITAPGTNYDASRNLASSVSISRP